MKSTLSTLAKKLFRTISPVREIMSFANPERIKGYGINPSDVISFGGGWVNHESPKELQKAYEDIVKNNNLFHYSGGYSPTTGINSTKEAILKMEKVLYDIDNLKTNNIVIGQSSSQLTYTLLQTILNSDDKICLLDPSYCNYPLQIYTSTKAKILRFPVIDKNFNYTANKKETIAKFQKFLLKEKPKIILLVSPDNPTGKVLSDDFFNIVHKTSKSYGGLTVMDFAYKELTFTDKVPKYFSKSPDENFVSIHSNSKWGRNLGRRMGWIEANDEIVEAFESLLNTSILCPDTLHQMAFEEYISKSVNNKIFNKYVYDTKELYKETAEFTENLINKYVNSPYIRPDGGLYFTIEVKQNSAEFVGNLLRKTGVLVVPGWGFGKTLSHAVRISYGPLVYNHEKIKEGIKKIGEFIDEITDN